MQGDGSTAHVLAKVPASSSTGAQLPFAIRAPSADPFIKMPAAVAKIVIAIGEKAKPSLSALDHLIRSGDDDAEDVVPAEEAVAA